MNLSIEKGEHWDDMETTEYEGIPDRYCHQQRVYRKARRAGTGELIEDVSPESCLNPTGWMRSANGRKVKILQQGVSRTV